MNICVKLSKNKYKWLIIGLIVAVVLILIPMLSFADVGNSVSHSKRSSSSHSSSSSSHAGGFELLYLISFILHLGPVGWIILIALAVIYFKFFRGKNVLGNLSDAAANIPSAVDTGYRTDRESIQQLINEDPSFSEQMFISQVTNMFMRLQLAWMNKKWEEARPFESDALFNMHNMQLSQYISDRTTNKIEDICVKNTEIEQYRKANEFEYLDVIIKARFIDYVISDDTGKLIQGDDGVPVHMTYRWKMMRKQGVKSTYTHVDATACPNCGANISINQAGKCEYCGSIVTRGDYDWVLSEIEVISQN